MGGNLDFSLITSMRFLFLDFRNRSIFLSFHRDFHGGMISTFMDFRDILEINVKSARQIYWFPRSVTGVWMETSQSWDISLILRVSRSISSLVRMGSGFVFYGK